MGLQPRTTRATDYRGSGRELQPEIAQTDRALRVTRSARVHTFRFSVSQLERATACAASKNKRTDRRALPAIANAGGHALPQPLWIRQRNLHDSIGLRAQWPPERRRIRDGVASSSRCTCSAENRV